MAKLYKTDGNEWTGKTCVMPNGNIKSGETLTPDSVRVITAEELKERGVEPIPHVPVKRVEKVKTKNTPTSLRKLGQEATD